MLSLEQRDCSDPSGAGVETSLSIFPGDAAERENRNVYGSDGFGKLIDAAWCEIGSLRKRREDWAKQDVVGAFLCGRADFLVRVAGNANQESGGRDRAELRRLGRAGWEMQARRSRGKGHIHPGVHDDFRSGGCGDDTTREVQQIARGELLVADLNPASFTDRDVEPAQMPV